MGLPDQSPGVFWTDASTGVCSPACVKAGSLHLLQFLDEDEIIEIGAVEPRVSSSVSPVALSTLVANTSRELSPRREMLPEASSSDMGRTTERNK